MEFLESLVFLESEWTVVVRLCLAVLCGGLIGMEREHKHRVAGFRTHILVCLGASLTTMTSQYLWTYYNPDWIHAAENALNIIPEGQWVLDPARIGAQVIAGIGFIGAGTIIVTKRKQVKGLTTAAGLWTTAIVGLAIGTGFYLAVIYTTVLILIVEVLFSKLEFAIAAKARDFTLYVEYGKEQSAVMLMERLRERQVRVVDMQFSKVRNAKGEELMSAILTVHFEKNVRHEAVLTELAGLPDVIHIHEL